MFATHLCSPVWGFAYVLAPSGSMAVPARGPGKHAHERGLGGRRGSLRGEVSKERDPHRAQVVVLRVARGDRQAGGVVGGRDLPVPEVAGIPALVDPTLLVDQVVVADVEPAPGDRVVVVDGAHRRRRIGVVVAPGSVMDDQLLQRKVFPRPELVPGGVEAQRLVRAPLAAGDDRRHHRGAVGLRTDPERDRLWSRRVEGQDGQLRQRAIGTDPHHLDAVHAHHRAIGLAAALPTVAIVDLDRDRGREGLPVGAEGSGHDGVGVARPVNGDVGRVETGR